MSQPTSPPPIDLRGMIFSNGSHVATGYGNQAKHLLRICKQLGLTPAEFAFYGLEGGVLQREGTLVYPKGFSPWGDDIAASHAQHFGADFILALLDSWVLNMDLFAGQRLILYAPIDHDPAPGPILDKLRQAWLAVMYSKFAVEKAQEQGVTVAYAPHSIDCTILHPVDRMEARRALGWPTDRPILVTVAANKGYPSRKCWPQMIKAFAAARHKHPDMLWYCHTTTGERGEMQGMNLRAMAERRGVEGAMLFPNQYQLLLGYNDEYMRLIYSAADAFYLASGGEGFGIPLWEALACGTPVITTNVTAQRDLYQGGAPGWYLDERHMETWDTPLNADQFIPQHGPLTELLTGALDTLTNMPQAEQEERYRKPARQFAEGYHVDHVAQTYWRPIFQYVAERIRDETRMAFGGQAQHHRDVQSSQRIAAPADRYAFWLNRWSDIQAHLTAFYHGAKGLVVELGTRSGVSTSALLAGVEVAGGTLVSVDLDPASGRLFSHPQWRFIQGSSTDALVVEQVARMGQIDALLIDTEHTYAQVTAELKLWAPLVRDGGTIWLHDPVSYPEVKRAIEDWCRANGQRADYDDRSNGLGVVRVIRPAPKAKQRGGQ